MGKIWEPQSIEVYQDWIKSILDEASDKLNDWENSFIESIENQLTYKNLSESQAEKLEQIYIKHTS